MTKLYTPDAVGPENTAFWLASSPLISAPIRNVSTPLTGLPCRGTDHKKRPPPKPEEAAYFRCSQPNLKVEITDIVFVEDERRAEQDLTAIDDRKRAELASFNFRCPGCKLAISGRPHDMNGSIAEIDRVP